MTEPIVYVVVQYHGTDENAYVWGVFTTREQAEAVAARYPSIAYHADTWIEERILDREHSE